MTCGAVPRISNQQSAISHQQLLRLFVRRVLPAEAAELAELQPLGRLLLVLRRAVIAPLTVLARQRDDVSHDATLRALDFGLPAPGPSAPKPTDA
jgi:hypothetical protein